MNITSAIAAAAVLFAAQASAQEAPSPERKPILVQGEKQDGGEEKKVCTRSAATGSIMPKRVCRTVRTMNKEEEQAQHSLERMRPVAASGISDPG